MTRRMQAQLSISFVWKRQTFIVLVPYANVTQA